MSKVSAVMASVVPLALAGCVTFTPTKTILEDPRAYLDNNFSEAKLADNVKQKLAPVPSGSPLRTVVLESTQVLTEGEKKTEFSHVETHVVFANGLDRLMNESKSNGITASYSFQLRYGPRSALYQYAPVGATNANFITQDKAIKSIDLGIGKPNEKSTYKEELSYGLTHQLSGFSDLKITCSTDGYVDAATINPSLKGKAVPMNCEWQGSNAQTYLRTKHAYLVELGIFFDQESTRTTDKRVYTLRSVTVR